MGTFPPTAMVVALSVLCVHTQAGGPSEYVDTGDGDVELPCGGFGGRCPRTVIQPNGVFAMYTLKTSCKAIKAADAHAQSGEYFIRPNPDSQKVVKAYCEMGLHGGGYTFLHPTALTQMTDAQLQAIFTDRRSFLMRYRESNGRQSYSVLEQLLSYSSRNLKLGLNQNMEYTDPVNKGPQHLNSSYLFFGFIPARQAQSNSIQGLRVNGHEVTFRNCDRNPNSYIALFPNFAERTPSPGSGFGGGVCGRIAALKRHTPSGRVMPVDYFMFTELHFGGCGCYGSTDHRSPTILATTIGFR